MTAAVPDPRFRDQLVEDLALAYSGRTREAFDAAPAEWRQAWFDDTEALIPVVEARVQAAANQRAAEELRDAADEMDDWAANAQRYRATVTVDSIENATATARLMAYERSSAVLHRRAAALASPAPAPRAEEGQS